MHDIFAEIAEKTEKLHNELHKSKKSNASAKKTIHYISRSTYEELLSNGVVEIVDGCADECEYHVKGIGRVF